MKIKYLSLIGLIIAFGSCSTAYRSGQTPDDVYYSPAPEENTYVTTQSDQDRNSYNYRNDEEQEIRRGIQNPVYRNSITLGLGYGYGYSPYSYYPSYGFNNPYYGNDFYYGKGYYDPFYSPYSYNNFYNPYYNFYNPYSFYGSPYYGYGYGYGYGSPIFPGRVNTNTGARKYNLNPYNNNSLSNSRIGIRNEVRSNISNSSSAPVRTFGSQRPNTNTGVGNVIRRVFTPSENRTNNRTNNNIRNSNRSYENNRSTERPSYQAPTRTFEPSSNSNSNSSSGSNNSSAPVRTFRR